MTIRKLLDTLYFLEQKLQSVPWEQTDLGGVKCASTAEIDYRDLYFEKNQKLYQNQSSNGETLPKLNIGIYSKFDQY